MPGISAVKSMSAQEAKIRHQREYQERFAAVRNGQALGRVLEKDSQGVVPAKSGCSLTSITSIAVLSLIDKDTGRVKEDAQGQFLNEQLNEANIVEIIDRPTGFDAGDFLDDKLTR